MRPQIVNCTWKFQFQCPRQWSSLRETGNPKVRVCEACLKEVHWCATEAEVRARAAQGACVAIMTNDRFDEIVLGELDPDQ